MSKNFVFFGTSAFSVKVLETLESEGFVPACVITMPDRPKGRGLVVTPSPVKIWAQSKNIPVLQPEKLDSPSHLQLPTSNVQLFVVASYGNIIPKVILDIPPFGSLNIHPSLLPKLRGATPIQSAILLGLKETGVTIMLMDEKMDHGPIVAQEKSPLAGSESAPELEEKLAVQGAKLLAKTIPLWLEKKIEAIPQNDVDATFTKKFSKEDGLIDLAGNAEENYRKIRAFTDTIGTYFVHQKADQKIRVRIKKASFSSSVLHIERVIPENGKEISYSDFSKTT